MVSFLAGEGVWHTDIIIYKYVCVWGGGGAGDQKNKYVWRYDEIMIYLL